MHALFAEARVSGMQSLLLRSAFCMVINGIQNASTGAALGAEQAGKDRRMAIYTQVKFSYTCAKARCRRSGYSLLSLEKPSLIG